MTMATSHVNRRGAPARTPSSPKSTRKHGSAKPNAEAGQSELDEILGHFANARAVIETTCRSMENNDDYTEETSTLRVGLKLFNDAYDEFDLAIIRISRAQPRKTGAVHER